MKTKEIKRLLECVTHPDNAPIKNALVELLRYKDGQEGCSCWSSVKHPIYGHTVYQFKYCPDCGVEL